MFVKVLLLLTFKILSANVANIDDKITDAPLPKNCYDSSSKFLPNIFDLNPPKDKSVFFIESSCGEDSDGFVSFNVRQACSVESAARAHPDRNVYVLVTSLGKVDFDNTTSIPNHNYQSRVFSAVKIYKNVKFAHVNYRDYFKNSPVSFEQANIILPELGELVNDVILTYKAIEPLRLLTLWRFGGIYLDLDVIVLKPFKDLASDFLGLLDKSSVGDAVMRFTHKNGGHDYLQRCLTRIGTNGVFNESGKLEFYTIMKCYATMCYVKDWLNANISKRCQHLTLYPPDFFYPVHYLEWTHYFDKNQILEVFQRIQRSYAVHFWNKFSGHLRFMSNSTIPYAILARKFCPEVVKVANKYM